MNPHILMVMDNQLNPDKYTQKQLKQNVYAAYDAYADADAADAYYADAYYAARSSYYAYVADAAYWIYRYFKNSGENKQDYIDEINKDKK